MQLKAFSGTKISDDLQALSWRPYSHIQVFRACVMNRIRFITESREVGLKTQNSGVSVIGEHNGERKHILWIIE